MLYATPVHVCDREARAAELRALLLRDGGGVSAGSRKLQTDCVSARCERACECVDVGVITHVFRLSRSRSTCAWRAGLGAISEQLSAVLAARLAVDSVEHRVARLDARSELSVSSERSPSVRV